MCGILNQKKYTQKIRAGVFPNNIYHLPLISVREDTQDFIIFLDVALQSQAVRDHAFPSSVSLCGILHLRGNPKS